MAATELQKVQHILARARARSLAGANLANDIITILQFDKLSIEEVRKALRDSIGEYHKTCDEAQDAYASKGKELGEL